MAHDFHTYLSAAMDLAKNGTRDIIAAPGAGKQIWVFGVIGTTNANGTIKFLDSTPTDRSGTMPIGANGGFVMPTVSNPHAPYIKCATNTKLQAVLSADSDFDGIVTYANVNILT